MSINKKKHIKFRVTAMEKARFKMKCEKMGIEMSEFLRAKMDDHIIRPRLLEEDKKLLHQLFIESNRWQSIKNMFNKKDPKITEEVAIIITEFKNIINQYFVAYDRKS